MKNRCPFIFAACLLVPLVFFVLNQDENPQWKGTIEEENGVTVVMNPSEPLYGEITFDLEEDLSIGNEEDGNYLFYRVRGIETDSQGNIYVADMSNYRIQKFDKDGNYLQTIGRLGQGPGEFELPSSVKVDDITGEIFVKDSARFIEIFDKKGNPIKSYKLESALWDFRVIEEEESIIGIFKKQSDLKISNSICKVNLKDEITKVFAEFPTNQYLKRGLEGETMGIYTGYEKESFISKISSQLFVFGHSDRYLLHVMDKEGNLLQKIRKELSPRKFTKKIRKRFKEWEWGEYQPYFYLILSDSKGRIYVQTNKTWNEEAEEKEIDIFSKDGIYMYKTTLPKNTYLIRDGYLYALEVKKDELIKRFKIKNWEQIKIGIN